MRDYISIIIIIIFQEFFCSTMGVFQPKLRLSTFPCVHYPLLSAPVQSHSILPHPTLLLCAFHLRHTHFGSDSALLRGNIFPAILFTSSNHRFPLHWLLIFTHYENMLNILIGMSKLKQFSLHFVRRSVNTLHQNVVKRRKIWLSEWHPIRLICLLLRFVQAGIPLSCTCN